MTKRNLAPGEESRLQRVEALTRLLDNALRVPGTRFTVGLDPIIGLIPVVGDVASLGCSLYMLYEARQLGLPASAQARMLGNIGFDAVVGAVPLLGDLADFGVKANTRNLRLLTRHLERRGEGPTPPDEAR